MLLLYVVNEYLYGGYNDLFLDVTYLSTIVFGILVLVSKNPIISILFLIGLFLSISCFLLVAGITFIGISYLVVYIGAVSILFLFILMLINIRTSELVSVTTNSIALGILSSILFSFSGNKTIPTIFPIWYYDFVMNLANGTILTNIKDVTVTNVANITKEIWHVTSNEWEANLLEFNHITSIGSIMFSSHSIWLLITSMILLVAMIGAILITFKRSIFTITSQVKSRNVK